MTLFLHSLVIYQLPTFYYFILLPGTTFLFLFCGEKEERKRKEINKGSERQRTSIAPKETRNQKTRNKKSSSV